MDFGQALLDRTGAPVTEEHLAAFERTRCVLKGPITVPAGGAGATVLRGRRFTSANQVFRKVFNLYANVRPAVHLPGSGARFEGTDVVVVRENTEGAYTGEEEWEGPDAVVAKKRITRAASTRIARFAFEYAVRHDRRLVTAVHKANVHTQADGLFLECCRQVAKDFPSIRYSEQLADSLLTAMVLDPTCWDVLLCENLYGDLVSDLAAGLVGGLGLAPSGQYGSGMAVFEPCHGSAPDIAGRGLVNPTSLLLSAGMMLDFLGEAAASRWLRDAVAEVVAQKVSTTPDLGGTASTEEMASAVAAAVAKRRGASPASSL